MLYAELGTARSVEQLESLYDTYLFQRKYTNLKQSAMRIKDFLDSAKSDHKLSLSPLKRQLTSSNANLYSLAERLVALDSCRHVCSVVVYAQGHLSQVVHENQMQFVNYFLSNMKSSIEELDLFISETQLPRFVRIEMVVSQVNSIRWNETSEENSNYIDRLLHVIDDLKERLDTIGGGSLPSSLKWKVLKSAFQFTCDQLIEGYAKVKRCSTAGRRQMEFDLKALREAMAEVPDLPSIEHHLEYLHIWGETPDAILEFMLRRAELPFRLHRLLVASAPQLLPLSGAKRTDLITMVEQQCRDMLKAF